MTSEFDRLAMTRALALAERGLETTNPNPRVGCVIAKGDRIIAEGFHERAGEAHAEVAALRAAKEPVAGATVYVTLEPCSHHGRTPPCANALIEAKVARVVFAVQDPNPQVSGQGADALLRAGITVEAGLMEAEATELNIGFMKRMKHGLPWVRIKLAMSLDGRTALANGASQWITGESARFDVQRWRARCSAVMTGVGTVLADDPQLTVRASGFRGRQPLRIILDAHLRSPPGAKVFFGAAGSVGLATGTSPEAVAASTGEAIVFTALAGGIPVVAPPPESDAADPLTTADDMVELVKAFETLPGSVTASTDDTAAPARAETDKPAAGLASAVAWPTGTVSHGAKSPVTLSPSSGSTSASAATNLPASAAAVGSGSSRAATDSVDDATWAGAALSGAVPVTNPEAVAHATQVVGTANTPAGAYAVDIAKVGSAAQVGNVLSPAVPVAAAASTSEAASRPPESANASRMSAARAATSSTELDSLAARRSALLARGVRVEEVPADDGYLDLFAVLQKLAQLEVNEVLVEAGPTLAGQLLTTYFADELLLYIAPKLLGPQGRPLVNLPELQSLQDAWGFSVFDAKRFGDDLRIRLRPK